MKLDESIFYTEDMTARGPIRGTPGQWESLASVREAMRVDDVSLFATTIYDISVDISIRPEILLSIAALSTGYWRSYAWNTRCNYFGRDATPLEAGKNFGNGARSARAMLVHVWLLLSGRELPAELSDYRHLCVPWDEIITSGMDGKAKSIGDLCQCLGIPWEALENVLNDDLPFILKER